MSYLMSGAGLWREQLVHGRVVRGVVAKRDERHLHGGTICVVARLGDEKADEASQIGVITERGNEITTENFQFTPAQSILQFDSLVKRRKAGSKHLWVVFSVCVFQKKCPTITVASVF